jgi:hypothetical protein
MSDKYTLLVRAMCLYSTCIGNYYEAIRMSNPTLGLRRIPAGFYVKVQVDGIQWQTTNKAVHVDQDVIEWKERIDLYVVRCLSFLRVLKRI